MRLVNRKDDFLNYNLSTGRFNCEAKSLMFRKKLVVIKNKRIKLPKLKTLCPVTEKTDLKENIKILFNKSTDKTKVKAKFNLSQIFERIRYGALYATAAAVMCFVIYGSVMPLELTIASTAIIDGKSVGVVTDKAEFRTLYATVHDELIESIGMEFADGAKKVTFMPCIASKKSISDPRTLRQNIMALYDGTTSAYAIYVDDQLVCASGTKEDVENALMDIKAAYGNPETAEFVENIEVRQEYVTLSYIRLGENIKEELLKSKKDQAKYTVEKDDSLWLIARNNNMSVDDLYELNPDMPEVLLPGTVLNIEAYVPGISVKTTALVEGEFEIACNTEVVYDNTMPKGEKKVVTPGVNGTEYVKKDVVSINGDEVSENIYEQKVLKEPVAEVVKVGTKPNGRGTGSFIRPTYGTLSSRYGTRWNRQHQGVDIAASTGTAIYAADDGVVEYSGWEGGYGYLVKINHKNGYVTYYGHCSKLLVKQGQIVEKGDLIAKVGSTGRSTGPHLHFEVRLNGVPQNPNNYVGL